MDKPADYIPTKSVNLHKASPTLASDIRDVVRRFHDQPFTYKHVVAALIELYPRWSYRDVRNLQDSVRTTLYSDMKAGRVELHTRGKPGTGQSNWYRLTRDKEEE